MIHTGGLSQDQRLEAMSKLKQYQCRVLISTDLVGFHVSMSLFLSDPVLYVSAALFLTMNTFVFVSLSRESDF